MVKKGMEKKYRKQRSLLHPIRRLSMEVLQQIFAFAIDSNAMDVMPKESGSTILAPLFPVVKNPLWALALTCKAWHTVVIGSSMLWSTIFIDVKKANFEGDYNSTYLRSIAKQIHHSGCAPLSICIGNSERAENGPRPTPLPASIIHCLLPSAPRIRRLVLFLSLYTISHLYIFSRDLVNLEDVTIVNTPINNGLSGAEQHLPLEVFEECPRIRRLHALNIARPDAITVPPHLKEYIVEHDAVVVPLKSRGAAAMSVKGILARMRTLRQADHFSIAVFSSTAPECEKFTLPSVSRLTINARPLSAIRPIFSSLRLPHLTKLSVTARKRDAEFEGFESIKQMLRESRPPLTSFHLTTIPFSNTSLLQLWDSFATITDLRITRFVSLSGLISQLCTEKSTGGWLLPNLRWAMFKGRFNPACLEKLAFRISSSWNDVPMDTLELTWVIGDDIGHDEKVRTLQGFADILMHCGELEICSLVEQSQATET
ncbi:hypothetical protein CYLTODRAFT_180002 [Cylindrobasidium torrendii FP15055 ss-10]|uniref:Uncharacterized protein n=1 Tax=Cylindrobasidium torrendii FP15055 ss-10 TaxID=1314674 RepID=A0A0D7BJ62_9AGAR|nr:hypothetical protein CYLTODRAFT_180002 [Cylindrobasidium torrendii FP15055 ss-10]